MCMNLVPKTGKIAKVEVKTQDSRLKTRTLQFAIIRVELQYGWWDCYPSPRPFQILHQLQSLWRELWNPVCKSLWCIFPSSTWNHFLGHQSHRRHQTFSYGSLNKHPKSSRGWTSGFLWNEQNKEQLRATKRTHAYAQVAYALDIHEVPSTIAENKSKQFQLSIHRRVT